MTGESCVRLDLYVLNLIPSQEHIMTSASGSSKGGSGCGSGMGSMGGVVEREWMGSMCDIPEAGRERMKLTCGVTGRRGREKKGESGEMVARAKLYNFSRGTCEVS